VVVGDEAAKRRHEPAAAPPRDPLASRRAPVRNGPAVRDHKQLPPSCHGGNLSRGRAGKLVVWPVTLPGSWVASTKPEAVIARRQGTSLGKGEGGLWRRVIAGQGPG